MIHSKHAWGIVLAASLAAGGCAGEAARASSDELLVGEGAELGVIAPAASEGAEVSCEGLLATNVQFAMLSGQLGLIAAIDSDANREVVCVDTVEAVEEELRQTGRIDEAYRLLASFQASAAVPAVLGPQAADPDPVPDLESFQIDLRGDPDPVPDSAP